MNNDFQFSFQANIVKSDKSKILELKDLDYDNMFIEGIASTDDKDLEGETLKPKDFDLSYFMQVGKINDNHTQIIGEPREAKIDKDGNLFVLAYLYNTSHRAKEIYKDTFVMQADPNSTRCMSWSIEGQATERDEKNPKIVRKARITQIALTPTPINYKRTWAMVVKGLANGLIDGDELKPENFELPEILELKDFLNKNNNMSLRDYLVKSHKIMQLNDKLQYLPFNELHKMIELWNLQPNIINPVDIIKKYRTIYNN